jgi:WS/DGAT/MGAT family acyltransferase
VQQLTGLDAAFLALESPNTIAHVGGLSILDPSTAPEELDLQVLTDLISSRIHLVPVLRRKLRMAPLGLDQPYWEDDGNFDIEYHVRELGLPSPGTMEQLQTQVARLHARPLDRTRPLWESYLITGLEGGRVAVYTKIHHAAIDGVSGAELLTILLDLEPKAVVAGHGPAWDPRGPMGSGRLLATTMGHLATQPVRMVRLAADVVTSVPSLAAVATPVLTPVQRRLTRRGNSGSDGRLLSGPPVIAPTTPLNQPITAHRKCSFVTLSLDEVQEVKNAFGVTVNDVVMAITAGAVRRWLSERNALPSGPLVAMVPVSVRAPEGAATQGNAVSAMLAALPTHIADPVERLTLANHGTQRAKSQQAALPQGLVDDITNFAPPALAARAARVVLGSGLMERLPAFNLVISNVPGPPVPVYLAGARLVAHYPLSIVVDGLALNVTLIGYHGGLHFGLVADREVVPDLDLVSQWLAEELAHLVEAARALT